MHSHVNILRFAIVLKEWHKHKHSSAHFSICHSELCLGDALKKKATNGCLKCACPGTQFQVTSLIRSPCFFLAEKLLFHLKTLEESTNLMESDLKIQTCSSTPPTRKTIIINLNKCLFLSGESNIVQYLLSVFSLYRFPREIGLIIYGVK